MKTTDKTGKLKEGDVKHDVPSVLPVKKRTDIRLSDEPYFGEVPGETRRGGKFRFGVVRCCPEWHSKVTEKIRNAFVKNGIKSEKRISRAVDSVMYILRAQTTDRCAETDWCLKPKGGKAVALSYKWFSTFFHSKPWAVRSLNILRESGILTVDHSWIHVPKTEKEDNGKWIPWTNGKTPINAPQGWLVNYKPKTSPEKWTDFPVNYDLNEWLDDVGTKIDLVGEIDAGNDEMTVFLNKNAIIEGLKDGTLEMHQTLRDIGLCRKYAKREVWQNPPPRRNADGTLKKKQRRKTDMREYHAVAMVSKKFMSVGFTGKAGTKWEGSRMEEVCDLHTGVIPSVLLADAIIEKRKSGRSSRPSKKELAPVFNALEKLQSHRVRELPDGTCKVTRDGDVYMEAVREIENRVKTDSYARWYLGNFFSKSMSDGEKRDIVKPFFLKTVYIDDETRQRMHKVVDGHKLFKNRSRRFKPTSEAYVCTIFEDVLKREFPKFTGIVTGKYVTKEQKTELFDVMSQGEKILTRHVSAWLKKKTGIDTIRKHDALVTLVPPRKKVDEVASEKLIWNSVRKWS